MMICIEAKTYGKPGALGVKVRLAMSVGRCMTLWRGLG